LAGEITGIGMCANARKEIQGRTSTKFQSINQVENHHWKEKNSTETFQKLGEENRRGRSNRHLTLKQMKRMKTFPTLLGLYKRKSFS